MAKCYVCSKGPSTGHNVSNSNRSSKRTWKPNLQRVRALVDGKPKRIKVCTSCLKAGKVRKAARG
jgi:large subunit ribosomal protein L28